MRIDRLVDVGDGLFEPSSELLDVIEALEQFVGLHLAKTFQLGPCEIESISPMGAARPDEPPRDQDQERACGMAAKSWFAAAAIRFSICVNRAVEQF